MTEGLRRYGWVLLWCLPVALTLFGRPPVPIDETRYLGVAWEMWLRGDLLVPHLNGAPYSDKPPLLFWLFSAGWSVFGMNEWWPRLVPPLFALASLFLTARVARLLWPDQACVAQAAPWILAGTLPWVLYTPLTLMDTALSTFVLVAMIGLVMAAQGRAFGWLLMAAAGGLGILVKGPVMLLHIAFPAFLAPLWSTARRAPAGAWYPRLGLTLALALGIALMWVLPAIARGGADYAQAILWHQTADRIAESAPHEQPWWWYVVLLPLLTLPWSAWPALYRAWHRHWVADWGTRLLFIWMLPTFVTFSLISGKQPHYLLPLLPAFALCCARLLSSAEASAAAGRTLPWLASASAVTSAFVVAGFFWFQGAAYDLRPTATYIQGLEQADMPVAHVGKYHAQFQFLGRLTRPLVVLPDDEIAPWAYAHPDGYVVIYSKRIAATPASPVWRQRFRGQWVSIWSTKTLCDTNGCRLPATS